MPCAGVAEARERQEEIRGEMTQQRAFTGLELDDILALSIPIEDVKLCGVYFLITASGRIFYIGQSVDIMQRMRAHESAWGRELDRVAWILCGIDDLDVLEAYYIETFRPSMNSMREDRQSIQILRQQPGWF